MIRASVNVIPESSLSDVVDVAVEAERLGFERCWVYDEGLATRDVYVTMTAIAAATERLHIGPGVTNPYTRHVGQTAAAVATLDEASHGRAFLGVGAGGTLTLDPLAIERARPLTAVRETIEASRALFGGEPVTYRGEHVTLEKARLDHARADIEIWLAGRGPRMLGLGGASADGVMLDFIPVAALGGYVELIRDGAASTGNDPAICYSTAVVTDADSLDFVRPHMTYRLVDAPQKVKEALGMTEDDVARIAGAMAHGLDAAAEHVPDEWVLPFVIAGTVQECASQLRTLTQAHGLEEFLVPMFDMADQAGYLGRVAAVLEAV